MFPQLSRVLCNSIGLIDLFSGHHKSDVITRPERDKVEASSHTALCKPKTFIADTFDPF